MRKINLKSKGVTSQKDKEPSSGITLIVGSLLLLIAGGLYGGIYYVKSTQDKEIASVKQGIANIKKKLDNNKNFQEVYDFQERLLEIEKVAKNKVIQNNLLDQVSETTLNENTIQRLSIATADGIGKVDISTNVEDLNILAKQLEAYSSVDINGQAVLSNSSLKEEGVEAKISFSVNKDIFQADNTNGITQDNTQNTPVNEL